MYLKYIKFLKNNLKKKLLICFLINLIFKNHCLNLFVILIIFNFKNKIF